MSITLRRAETLSHPEVHAIRLLAAEQELRSAREALSGQAEEQLNGESAKHFLRFKNDHLEGYAQGVVHEGFLELEFLGDQLDQATLTSADDLAVQLGLRLAVWIHGITSNVEMPSSATLTRTLVRMERPLHDDKPLALPEGETLRLFAKETDSERWLTLNALCFEDHPDQGRLSGQDLERRLAQPWFDASGFFLIERQGDLRGFCWCKVHDVAWGRYGEIYVIGVDPNATRTGLGRILLSQAYAWFVAQGIAKVALYCEEENLPARALYASAGFTEVWKDQRWLIGER